jgi:hypothetical protein
MESSVVGQIDTFDASIGIGQSLELSGGRTVGYHDRFVIALVILDALSLELLLDCGLLFTASLFELV